MTGRGGPTHAVTNYGGDGSPPDGLRRIVRVGRSPALHEMILSRAPGTTLIIIFIDECSCRQDDEVASVLSDYRVETQPGFYCHQREIWPSSDSSFGLSDFHSSHPHSSVNHEPASWAPQVQTFTTRGGRLYSLVKGLGRFLEKPLWEMCLVFICLKWLSLLNLKFVWFSRLEYSIHSRAISKILLSNFSWKGFQLLFLDRLSVFRN